MSYNPQVQIFSAQIGRVIQFLKLNSMFLLGTLFLIRSTNKKMFLIGTIHIKYMKNKIFLVNEHFLGLD